MKSLFHILPLTAKKNQVDNKQSSASENHYQNIKDNEKSFITDALRGIYNIMKGLMKAPSLSPQASKTLSFLNKNYKFKKSTETEEFYSEVIKNKTPNSEKIPTTQKKEEAPQITTQYPTISVEEFLRKKGYHILEDGTLATNDNLDKLYKLKNSSSTERF